MISSTSTPTSSSTRCSPATEHHRGRATDEREAEAGPDCRFSDPRDHAEADVARPELTARLGGAGQEAHVAVGLDAEHHRLGHLLAVRAPPGARAHAGRTGRLRNSRSSATARLLGCASSTPRSPSIRSRSAAVAPPQREVQSPRRSLHRCTFCRPRPLLFSTVIPSGPTVSAQDASSSVQTRARVARSSARILDARNGTKHVSSSSTPSAAKAGAKGATSAIGRPAASSASTRWMAVSCAWRRLHKASGDGPPRNVQHWVAGPMAMPPRARRRARATRPRTSRRTRRPRAIDRRPPPNRRIGSRCAPRPRSRSPSGARHRGGGSGHAPPSRDTTAPVRPERPHERPPSGVRPRGAASRCGWRSPWARAQLVSRFSGGPSRRRACRWLRCPARATASRSRGSAG